MNILSLIAQVFFTIWFYVYGLITFLIASVIIIALVVVPKKSRLLYLEMVWGLFSKNLLKYGLGAKLSGTDLRSKNHRIAPSRGVYIGNHVSQMDVPLFLSQYAIYPIMKKEVLYIPIVGIVGYISGALPVDRSSKESRKKIVQKVIKHLKSGMAILYFPEGTRNKETKPKSYENIKTTLMSIGYDQKLPITPTSLYGARSLFKNGLVQRGKKIGIIVHKEIFPEDYENKEEFMKAAWKKVNDGFDVLEKNLKIN